MKSILKFFILLILLIFFLQEKSFSQVNFDWAKSYNPISNHNQSASDVAAGQDGAYYVLGYNGRGYNGTDVALVKYNSAGELKWAKSYDGGNENNSDLGKSVATFKSGSDIFIYATCDVSVSGYGNQTGLLKYDSSGNLLWVKNIASGPNSKVTKVALDNSGNVYVAGGTSNQPFIIKFNSNGDTSWMRKIPNPGDYVNGVANDLTVDSLGNVYATGKFNYPNVTGDDIVTVKFNSSGVLQWSKLYNYVNLNDFGNALSLKSGSLYVTGGSQPANGQSDIVLIKYDANTGDSVWVKRYNGTSNSYDDAKDVAVDAGGNICITGQTDGATYSGDAVTIKYNSSGTLLWLRKYVGLVSMEDAGKEIALDTSGNIYVAGRINFGAGAQYLAIKYNSNGDSLWTRLFDVGTSEEVFAMALDNNNNIVITGECDNLDMATVKYNSSGQLQWMRKFYGAQLIADYSNAVVADKNGNVYAAGKSRVSQYGDQFTVIKYNSAGVLAWVRSYGIQLFDNYDEAKAITIDASGYLIVTGTSYSRFTQSTDIFTVKLDSNGIQQWYALYNPSANLNEDARAITTDNSGNVYIAGTIQTLANSYNYITIKYNSAGTFAWSVSYDGPAGLSDYPTDITYDNNGSIIVTGYSRGAGTADDIATVKYNSSGIQQWVQRFNGSANGSDLGLSMKADKGGNVYVCGMAKETSTGYNSILLKYNSSGNLRWTKQDSNNELPDVFETGISIKLDTSMTKIYLAGHWSSESVENRRAVFIAKYDSGGNRIHRSDVLYLVGGAETFASGLALDSKENIFVSAVTVFTNGKTETQFSAYDSSGYPYQLFNAFTYPQSSFGPDSKEVIAVNEKGNVFIGCGTYDSTAGTLMTVLKYSLLPLKLRVNLLIQGFYKPSYDEMKEDTVMFYLRNSTPPYLKVDSVRDFPDYDGFFSFGFKNGNYGTNYYLTVKHRNTIETWSSGFLNFETSGLEYYDFTSSASNAYGNNQIKVDDFPSEKFAFYGGDVNQDGIVDGTDGILIDNDAAGFNSGYLNTDLNGDEIIDGSDAVIAENNAANFVSAVLP